MSRLYEVGSLRADEQVPAVSVSSGQFDLDLKTRHDGKPTCIDPTVTNDVEIVLSSSVECLRFEHSSRL